MIRLTRRRAVLALAAASALPTSRAGAQASGKLVLYTSQPDRDAQQTVAGFKAANPGVEVEIFRSGTTEIMAKLAAEFSAGDPRPDVLLIADSSSMEILKAAGRLEAYGDASLAGFRPQTYDTDKTYFGTKLITTGIAYNKAVKTVPAAWSDLTRPQYKGLISMPSPLYSGAAAILLGAFVQRPDLGWAFFEGLKANDAVAVRGNGAVLQAVARGEKGVGILVDFMAFNAKAQGSPVDFVVPKEGLTPVTEPVAILRTSKNKGAARAFVDFLLSEPGQKLAISQGYIPAREGVGNPAWLPPETKLELMPLDIPKIVATTDADKKKFSDLFGAS